MLLVVTALVGSYLCYPFHTQPCLFTCPPTRLYSTFFFPKRKKKIGRKNNSAHHTHQRFFLLFPTFFRKQMPSTNKRPLGSLLLVVVAIGPPTTSPTEVEAAVKIFTLKEEPEKQPLVSGLQLFPSDKQTNKKLGSAKETSLSLEGRLVKGSSCEIVMCALKGLPLYLLGAHRSSA